MTQPGDPENKVHGAAADDRIAQTTDSEQTETTGADRRGPGWLATVWDRVSRNPILSALAVAALLGLGGMAYRTTNTWINDRRDPIDQLTMRVMDLSLTDEGVAYVLPETLPIDAAGRPGGCPANQPTCDRSVGDEAGARRWVKSFQAYDVAESHINVILQNDSPEQLDIVGARARFRQRAKPQFKTEVIFPTAGASPTVGLLFDLDSRQGNALANEGETNPGEARPYFDRKFITLRPGERQPLDIIGRTTIDTVTWTIEFSVVSERTKREVLVPLEFRTSPPARADRPLPSAARKVWEWSQDRFVPARSDA